MIYQGAGGVPGGIPDYATGKQYIEHQPRVLQVSSLHAPHSEGHDLQHNRIPDVWAPPSKIYDWQLSKVHDWHACLIK